MTSNQPLTGASRVQRGMAECTLIPFMSTVFEGNAPMTSSRTATVEPL